MALLTRNGKRLTGLNLSFFLGFIFIFANTLSAQTPLLCSTSATNQDVRSEGLTEPVGSILLNCTGGTPGQTVSTNLTATFPTAVTNRVNSAGNPDTLLTVDNGSGPLPTGSPAVLLSSNTLAFNGVTATVPATRALVFRLTNVRLAVNLLPAGSPVTAYFSSTSLSVTSSTAVVATPRAALLSNGANTGITCAGSPLPATFDVPGFFAAGTRFSSLRVTEGFGNAFIPKDASSDSGTRIVVNYSNFPTSARVFLPDFVAGNSATQPTAAGDLGGTGTPTGGVYTPTNGGTLLLARVIGHDANGAGGAPIATKAAFTGQTALKSVTEVALTGGAGVAVYEVIDASDSTQEIAQFPTFIGLSTTSNAVTIANAALTLGPVSIVATATPTDPVPRFRRTAPASDCQFVGDCNANYFPLLSVFGPAAINFRSPLNGLQDTEFFQIINQNPGTLLSYSVSVSYQNGSGFVFISPSETQGNTNASLRVILNASGLTPGVYQAQVIISAGSAGSRTIPITVTVDPPVAPAISISSVTNAATLAAGPLVAGSLGTIKGVNLAGTNVAVTFDGIVAPILFKSATQINFQVPSALAAKTTSQLVVTVDGVATKPQAVTLAAAAPGIFGVLNQDGTVNASGNPAAPGSILQIFATGLPTAGSLPPNFATTQVEAIVSPSPGGPLTPSFPASVLYAGDAPGLVGVQQVNVALTNPTAVNPQISICSTNLVLRACSPPFPITVR